MVRIILDNNKSRLIADRILLHKIAEATKIRKPGAWWSPKFGAGGWDGYLRYISEDTGLFQTGLLYQIVAQLEERNIKFQLEDSRSLFREVELRKEFENGDVLRDDQERSVRAVLENRYLGVRFQRGILDEATNYGKSYVAAGIFGSYSDKRHGLLLINNTEIFAQLYPDLQKLLGKSEVGCVSSRVTNIRRINVCMVQTLGIRLKKDTNLRNLITQTDIIIVDEADETGVRKDGKMILGYACNAPVRVALSGSALLSKDKTRNQQVLAYFGPTLNKTTNKELVGRGVSTKPIIEIYDGNKTIMDDTYEEEYYRGIVMNRGRHKRIWRIVKVHLLKGHSPVLILVRQLKHINRIYLNCPQNLFDSYVVETTHGDDTDRRDILSRFKKGKIDVLICSMIIRRGMNMPMTQVLVNGAGGKSHAGIVQIFGRLLRSHESKKVVYMVDLFDQGNYLRKHSKRRVIYYKNEGFGIKELYKKKKTI